MISDIGTEGLNLTRCSVVFLIVSFGTTASGNINAAGRHPSTPASIAHPLRAAQQLGLIEGIGLLHFVGARSWSFTLPDCTGNADYSREDGRQSHGDQSDD